MNKRDRYDFQNWKYKNILKMSEDIKSNRLLDQVVSGQLISN